MRIPGLVKPALGSLLTFAIGTAHAGEHVYTATDPTWQAECGACHIAYPAQLLPASSWRRIMAGLNDHFGSDASVDAQAAQSIGRFLEANATTKRKRVNDNAPRITETAWFRKEHDEVAARIGKDAAVKSASNCAACHTRAEQGDYGERSLRVPR
jgi:hypothetical protein